MRKMKYVRLIAVLAIFCMAMAACGTGGGGAATTTAAQTAPPAANPPKPVDASATTAPSAGATTTAATTAAAAASTTAAATTTTAAATSTATAETTTTIASETTSYDVGTGDIMSPYGPYPETITITTAKSTPANANFFLFGDSSKDNEMTRYIRDKVNIQVELAWEVPGENSGFANRMALQVAANDIPDMFTLGSNDYLLYRQLADNNMLADLQAGFDACANDYVRNTLGTYEGRNLAPFYQDGKLLAFAGGRYGYEHNQLWYRADWLEEYGFEVPSSLEDIEEILRTWKSDPPSEEYQGFILHHEKVGSVYDTQSAAPIFAIFGSYPNAWVSGSDGQVVWGSVAPETKQGLEVLARWYSEGLLDQQFMTRSAGGARTGMIVANQTGMFFSPWHVPYGLADFHATHTNGEELLPTNAPLDANGDFNIMFPGAAGDYVMIRNGYEHPEALFKILNCEFDMWRGFDFEAHTRNDDRLGEGVSWGYLFPSGGMNVEPENVIPNMGLYFESFIDRGEHHPDAMPSQRKEAEDAAAFLASGKTTIEGWAGYYCRYIASSPSLMLADNINIKLPEYYYVTESMADIKPNLDTLENTTFLQIVTGEVPIDAFDDFVTQWYAQGGQTITDEVRALVGGN